MTKLFYIALLFFFYQNSYASPTDCVQTASDGTAQCIPANGTWNSGVSFPVFQDLLDYNTAVSCAAYSSTYACKAKDFIGVWDGRVCSGYGCDMIDQPDTAYKQAPLYYAYSPNKSTYYVGGGIATYSNTCPKNYTIVTPDPTYGFAICKPPINNNDSGCPSGNCKKTISQGVVTAADPVNVGSGNKYEVETDYLFKSTYPLTFTRYYNDQVGFWYHNYTKKAGYIKTSLGEFITLSRPNNESITFKNSGGWVAVSNNNTLEILSVDSQKIEIKNDNNEIETYESLGVNSILTNALNFRLTKIKMPGGATFNLTYTKNGLLSGIIDPFSRKLTINSSTGISGCNKDEVVTSIVSYDNLLTTYQYNNSCQMTKVIYPDNTFKEYVYSGTHLESVKDELGNIYQYNTYNYVSNRPSVYVNTSNGLGTNGMIQKVNFSYPTPTSSRLTDARNNIVNISVKKDNGLTKATAFDTLCTFCNGIQGSSITYNSNGFVDTVTDFKGNVNKYVWDTSRNLLLSSTEGYGTSLARTTSMTYSNDYKLPVSIVEPVSGGNKVTNITYNSFGKPTTINIDANDSFSNQTRTYQYIYDDLGQLIEINEPLNKTTISYTNGLLQSASNGLQQTTYFSDYNGYGQPQTIILPDTSIMALTYNLRGKVLTSTKKNSSNTKFYTTTYSYNLAGLLTKLTYPAGNYNKINYDIAHRVSSIEEYDESNVYIGKTVYTLDNMSNLTSLQVLNSSGVEILLKTAQYDNKNRLYKDIGAVNQTNTVTYDANGNLQQITDANNKNVVLTYDSLNRLSTQTNQDNGVIKYSYNPDDSLATVTDPKNITTQYSYNGFGELIQTISKDAGTVAYARDTVGNIVQITDAKNNISNYTYDLLNRVTSITYTNDSSKNMSFVYDCDSYSTGKLCSISDNSGTTTYSYNDMGQIISKTSLVNNFSTTISYNYDNYGRVNQITYPSGNVANYSYVNNHVANVQYNGSSVISNAIYDAFSSVATSYVLGNTTYTRNINKDGLVSSISTNPSVINKTIGYDSRSNINNIIDNSKNFTIGYDEMSRITSYSGVNNFVYSYNTTGDRNSKTTNGATQNYVYDANSHRLNSNGSSTFLYDNAGNVTKDNNKTWNYDVTNRMSSYSDGIHSAVYQYNALGQRVYKNVDNTQITNFVYDEAGNLIAEYVGQNLKIEYIYFNGSVVAINVPNNGMNQIYYVFSDHLGTPRNIVDNSNNVVWTWDNVEPFGDNSPVKNNSNFIDFNLRFPGQYYDIESGLNYNYYRDYNNSTGRYVQSDPMGLSGGINTYGYVNANSLNSVDPLGLKAVKLKNCIALLNLIDYERKNKGNVFIKKYNLFNFAKDVVDLNASYDSIGGKVDIDWMIRSSSPIPVIGEVGYYAGKPFWNFAGALLGIPKDYINNKLRLRNFNPFINMNDEGHKNAPAAARYYLLNNTTLEEMFKPAINDCQCKIDSGYFKDEIDD